MKFSNAYSLKQIADILNCEFVGDSELSVLGLNEIHVVQKGDVVFVDHPKYYAKALNSEASVVMINKKVECPKDKALLISKKPFTDFNKLISYFQPFEKNTQQISPTAEIGKNTILQPGVFIGDNVKIGKNCVVFSNTVIYNNTVIGDNVTIQAGSVIGAEGFYYKKREMRYEKLISGGNVVIEDFVDVGAICTIDRGVTASTIIKKGTKLDNHVHIGHDTIIGENCLLAAGVAIGGCAVLEKNVTMWGQVGMTSGATIGENAVILAQTGIAKSLAGNKTYFGYPAGESYIKLRELAALRKLIKNDS